MISLLQSQSATGRTIAFDCLRSARLVVHWTSDPRRSNYLQGFFSSHLKVRRTQISPTASVFADMVTRRYTRRIQRRTVVSMRCDTVCSRPHPRRTSARHDFDRGDPRYDAGRGDARVQHGCGRRVRLPAQGAVGACSGGVHPEAGVYRVRFPALVFARGALLIEAPCVRAMCLSA